VNFHSFLPKKWNSALKALVDSKNFTLLTLIIGKKLKQLVRHLSRTKEAKGSVILINLVKI
jgi:hypothetical protein